MILIISMLCITVEIRFEKFTTESLLTVVLLSVSTLRLWKTCYSDENSPIATAQQQQPQQQNGCPTMPKKLQINNWINLDFQRMNKMLAMSLKFYVLMNIQCHIIQFQKTFSFGAGMESSCVLCLPEWEMRYTVLAPPLADSPSVLT